MDEALTRATEKLLDFTLRSKACIRQGLAAFLGRGRKLEDWERDNFLAYLAHGQVNDRGERMLDVFLRDHSGLLDASERVALEDLKQAWFSLFEVQEVHLDKGLDLLDPASGERLSVREKLGTHGASKYALIMGWVVWREDHYVFAGAAVTVNRSDRVEVQKAINRSLRRARKARPDVSERELSREAIAPAHRALRRSYERRRKAKVTLTTMDGEETVFCSAVFDLRDVGAVRQQLVKHPDIDGEDNRYTWLDRKGRRQLGPGPLILGTITLGDERLMLETKSRERLEKGKQMLGQCLGNLVRHRMDTLKDFDVAMEEHRKGGPAAQSKSSVPPEVAAEAVRQCMQQRMEDWIDTEIPALAGKTPRQAVRTKRGREKVISMLKDQEHTVQRWPGGDRIDFMAIWRMLGLAPDR